MGKRFANENFPPDIQAKADQMNLDEDKVPAWTAPPLPFDQNITGTAFATHVRPALIQAMEKHLYGKIPPRCQSLDFRLQSEGTAFDGLAIRREYLIVCRHNDLERAINLLLYLPADLKGPFPVFFGLNFKGNHTISNDPGVTFHPFVPYPDLGSIRLRDDRATEEQRGNSASRWQVERVLQRGFAVATACYWDIYPDHPHGFAASIIRLFYNQDEWEAPTRDTGAISAWAWGISRCLDCLETQPEIDPHKMIVHGHSRLGKTALWAGACDSRIALTVSNCSGTGGAKMCHRYFGEDFAWLEQWNPHWFRKSFYQYANHDREFPVDQHFLMAAVAPRLLYVASATDDEYADPRGEFASAVAASPAWQICGGTGLGTDVFPEPEHLIGNEIGYFLRTGEHNFTQSNWDALLEFVTRRLL